MRRRTGFLWAAALTFHVVFQTSTWAEGPRHDSPDEALVKQVDASSAPRLVVNVGHSSSLSSAAISPDGRLIATAAWYEPAVRLWDAKSNALLHILHNGSDAIHVGFCGTDVLVVLCKDAIVCWKLGFHPVKQSVRFGPSFSLVCDVNRGVFLVGRPQSAEFWELDRTAIAGARPPANAGGPPRDWLNRKYQLVHEDTRVRACGFHPTDPGLVFTGDDAGVLRLWSLAEERPLASANVGKAGVNSLAIAGKSVVVTGSDDGSVASWSWLVDGGHHRLMRDQVFTGHTRSVRSIALVPDSARVVSTGDDGTIWIHDIDAKNSRAIQHTGKLNDQVIVMPDSREFLVLIAGLSASDAALLRFTFPDGLKVGQLGQTTNRGVLDLSYSPDGGSLVIASGDHRARVLSLREGRVVREFTQGERPVTAVAWSPDGQIVVTASEQVALWNPKDGQAIRSLPGLAGEVSSLAFSGDSQFLAATVGSPPGLARAVEPPGFIAPVARGIDTSVMVWNVATNESTPLVHDSLVHDVAFIAESPFLVTAGADGSVNLWDYQSGQLLDQRHNRDQPPQRDGVLSTLDANWAVEVVRLQRRKTIFMDVLELKDGEVKIKSSKEPADVNHLVLAGGNDGLMRVYGVAEISEGETVKQMLIVMVESLRTGCGIRAIRRLSGANGVVVACEDGSLFIWSPRQPDRLTRFLESHADAVTRLAPRPGSQWLTSGSWDGTLKFWDVSGPEPKSLLNGAFTDGQFVSTTPAGQFDVVDMDTISGLHWVFPDDPFRPLSPEIFMREYYEPRLVQRILSGEQFPHVRDLTELNRVQPVVKVLGVDQSPRLNEVVLTAQVSPNEGTFQQPEGEMTKAKDAYDVRVFRDGQLVGQWPEPPSGHAAEFEPDPSSASDMQKWRELNRVVPDGSRVTTTPDGKMAITFPVRLPHRDAAGSVEFTAYGFNEDRVKSETARFTYDAPANPATTKPRAYLIGMGVSVSENTNWNLKFAANDARLTVEEFSKSLPQYDVVPVLLTSESGIAPPTATRENLRTVLQLLSGHDVLEENKAGLPNADQLQLVTPDDLVLVAFSGHGYTDPRGILHLLPYDVGSGQEEFEKVLPRCISSGDLAAWMKDTDAGELVLILDACHSAAAGAPPGFKPGPLGGRGLAQLAYDKGMRVLAASQANDVALECERIQHGLLTYSLIREGLQNGEAAREDTLTLGGLLAYAAERVPSLYEGIVKGTIEDISSRQVRPIQPADANRSKAQTPELFDYARKRPDILLSR